MIILALIFLFFFGAGVNLFYGRLGYMPLDQSIVFDGGWRILSGQIPYRDFVTPCGIVPIYLQALLFKIFGVTWFSYILHASLFNGLFCALGYWFLRSLRVNRWLAFLYALATSLLFYPPFGVPYVDQHAFFFLFLAITLTVWARTSDYSKSGFIAWFFIPFAISLAALSKQSPTSFGIPMILLLFLMDERRKKEKILAVILGASACFSLLFLWTELANIDLSGFKHTFWDIPSSLAGERFLIFQNYEQLTRSIGRVTEEWNFKSFGLFHWEIILIIWFVLYQKIARINSVFGKAVEIPLRFIPFFLFSFAALRDMEKLILYDFPLIELRQWVMLVISALLFLIGMFGGHKDFQRFSLHTENQSRLGNTFWKLFLAIGLVAISYLFVLTTHNQSQNGVCWIFLALAIPHGFWLEIFAQIENQKLKKFALLLSAFLFIWLAGTDVIGFNTHINVTRRVHDFNPSFQALPKDESAPAPEALSFMDWKLPPQHTAYSLQDLSDLLQFLKSNEGNFFLFGDSSILYALAGKPSTNITLWLHQGLTMPALGSPDFKHFEENFMNHLLVQKIKYVILEGNETWTHLKLSDFHSLQNYLSSHTKSTVRFGPFQVIELTSPSN